MKIHHRGSYEQRLQRLEVENRRLKNLVFLVFLGGVVFVCLGMDHEITPLVETNEIRLRNEEGKLVAWLKPEKNGASFSIIDENGIARTQLGYQGKQSYFTLCNHTRNTQVSIQSTIDGPLINLYDANGHNRALLGTYQNETYLWLLDDQEQRRAGMSIDEQQTGIVLQDAGNTARVHAGFDRVNTQFTLRAADGSVLLQQ